MKSTFLSLFIFLSASLSFRAVADSALPAPSEVMSRSAEVAAYFMNAYPDVGATSNVGDKVRSSKIWTRSVFYEGLLNLWREEQRPEWLDYTVRWGEFHKWVSSSDTEAKAHNADYQCCGQSYLQLYMLDPSRTERMTHIKMRIDDMMATGRVNFWTWIDAIQMSMPVMAMLGDITGDTSYWTRMYELYAYTRDKQGGSKKGGGSPLFNTSTGLWYRDYQFDPPYRDLTDPTADCYWSRGNGWVYMALARVMQFTPASELHRPEYEADFRAMSEALLVLQRTDGSWNVSLHAPANFGSAGSEGPEMTGTSLFLGGMAWGVRTGLLDRATYLPAIARGWESMSAAVRPDGSVGYMQGTGSKPEDGGPITYLSQPDFEDFGIGCWLWGAAEIHALAAVLAAESGIESVVATPADAPTAIYDLYGRRVTVPVRGQVYIRPGEGLFLSR